MNFIDHMAEASGDDEEEASELHQSLLEEQYESDIIDDSDDTESNFMDYYRFEKDFEKKEKKKDFYNEQNEKHIQQQKRAINIMKYESQHRAPYPSQSPTNSQNLQREEEINKYKTVLNTIKVPEKWRSLKARRRANVRSRKPLKKKRKYQTFNVHKKKKSVNNILMQKNATKKVQNNFMKRVDVTHTDSYGGYSIKSKKLEDPFERVETGAVVSTFNIT